jgi:hypothetical protein
MTTKIKAKRILKDITFNHDSAHLALCTSEQGTANMMPKALLLKGASFSPEYVEKMQAVRVTMDIPEFLERFFGLWGSDAEVLAAMMGYVEPVETPDMEIKDWVAEKLQSFEIMKSLYESKDLEQSLAALNEKEYLAFLIDQETIEKAIKESESVNSEKDTSVASEVSKEVSASVDKLVVKAPSKLTKGKSMPKAQEQVIEQVEKSKFDALEQASVELQKSLDEKQVELQKAMQEIAEFKAEKLAAVIKSKTSAITAVVKDEKQAAVITKAALLIEDAAEFDGFVAVIKQMQEQVEKSALFQEHGASGDAPETVQKSAIEKLIEAKFSK